VCQRNDQIKYYLGNTLKQNKNKKLRELFNKILENTSIQRIRSNPIVVKFVTEGSERNKTSTNENGASDLSDLSAPRWEGSQTRNEKNGDGKKAIENSSEENNRSQGSRENYYRAVSIRQLSPPTQTKDSSPMYKVSADDNHYSNSSSMIMQLPNSNDDPSLPVIAPNDNDMQTDGGRPNKSRIRYTDDGRHDKVFWRIFDELEAATPTRDRKR
jgi:hypothetical protein